MATRPCDDLKLNAKSFTSGIIPQKVSDLQNDVPYVSKPELDEILGLTGAPSQDPLLVSMSDTLTPEQKAQVKENLGITDFVAEAVPSGEIIW